MKIPFVGPAYRARSLNADAQRAVNCYLETDTTSERAPVALYGRPGSTSIATLTTAGVRGAIQHGSYVYWVSGDSVYRMSSTYAVTLLGTISTRSGPVGMASNGTQILIVDGVGGWIATSSALTAITDPDFPAGVRKATYIASFFVVTGDGSGQFYWNETANEGTAWNGLDFASAEGSPDDTVACITNQMELYLVGQKTAEVWIMSGDADSPFQRSGNTFIQVGTSAASSVAALDNTIFWLGQDENGAGMVFRAEGYTPRRVSDHGVETALQGYSTISDAEAFTFQMEGHSFYVLTFPSEDATWVYDVSTGAWFEWAWRDPDANTLHRWRASCHVFFNNKHLVGDWETGDVYELDLDTFTDDGDPILFLRSTQCLDSEGERLFYESLQVDMETGVGLATGQGSDPQVMLRYSNDGGHTWSNIKTKGIGAAGRTGARVKFGPLGSGRNRVWEISITDPVKRHIFGAFASVEKGV